MSNDAPVRVGAQASITSPVVLGFDHEKWRFQPTTRLTGDNAEAIQPASFSDTRTEAPEDIVGPFITGTLVTAGIAYPWGFYLFAVVAVFGFAAMAIVPKVVSAAGR